MTDWLQTWQGAPSWTPAWDVLLILGLASLSVLALILTRRNR